MGQLNEDRSPVWTRLLSLASYDPQRAVRIAQKAFDRTTHASIEKQTLARYVLGRALLRYEELEAAFQHLDRAATQFAAQNKSLLALQARRDALFAAMLLRKSNEQAWMELVKSYAAADQPLEKARTQMYLCAHYNRGGRPRAALELAASCAPILETQGTQEDRGRMLRIKAAAHGDCGEFGKALLFADEAVSVFRRLGWPVEIALSLTERAWHRQTIGEYHAALVDLLEAHHTFSRVGLPLRIAICELHLGLLSSRLGQYEIALALTQIARQRFAELDQDPLFALCDLNTGIIFHYAGLNKQALRAYQHAEHVYRALGNQRMLLVSQRNQALALRQLDRYQDALKLLGDLQQEAEQLEDQDEQAELALASGEVLHDLGRYPEALAQLANAQHLFATTSKPAAVAQCLLEQGWILLKQGAVEQAHEHFAAALPALRYRPMHRWRALHGLARCSAERGEQYVALDYYRETSGIIALLRTQLLSEHASSRIFAQAEEAYTQALNLALKLGDTDTVLELAETQRSLSLGKLIQRNSSGFTSRALALDKKLTLSPQQYADTLDVLVEELLRQRHHDATIDSSQWLDMLQKVLASDSAESRFDFDELSQLWSSTYSTGWTALIYIHCGDQLVVITADAADPKPRMEIIVLDGVVRGLLNRANLLIDRLETYYNPDGRLKQPSERWDVLHRLGPILIPAHVQERLAPGRRLLIVPSAELHALPWAALRIQDHWLIERAIIQLLPALSLWSQLAERRSHHSQALLMAVSEFQDGKEALPSALKTLDIAERHWIGDAERLKQNEASYLRLMQKAETDQLRQYGLIHIATHAELEQQGLFAKLALADEHLFYDDIVRLRVHDALVVLVVCDGAKVQVLKGEEVLSLNRAFLAAGARDVIASLWPLYDTTVLDLVIPLYQALRLGADAPTAVAYAQRALIAQGKASDERNDFLASPAMWASLCAMGAGVVGWPPVGGTRPTDEG